MKGDWPDRALLVGSIRRECLDHVIVFGERHLRHVLRFYAHYYNGRPNTSVTGQGLAANESRPGHPPAAAYAFLNSLTPRERLRAERLAQIAREPGSLAYHYAFSGGGEVIVQIDLKGPFENQIRQSRGRFEQEKLIAAEEGSSPSRVPCSEEGERLLEVCR